MISIPPNYKPDWKISQDDMIKLLSQQTEAGNALVIAGLVDDELQKLLLNAMRELSNNLAERLFDGYGPLKDFAAKIDIAFAFKLIDEKTHADLRVIKDVRNKFAHAIRFTFFSSPEIVKLCAKLSNYKKEGDCQIYFRTRAVECINLIKAATDNQIFRDASKED
jgi:DNA-binding MltR family transcriptional regulator